MEGLYSLEDFVAMSKLMETLPEGSPLLVNIGNKLQSVGLCDQGVAAFLKVLRCVHQAVH